MVAARRGVTARLHPYQRAQHGEAAQGVGDATDASQFGDLSQLLCHADGSRASQIDAVQDMIGDGNLSDATLIVVTAQPNADDLPHGDLAERLWLSRLVRCGDRAHRLDA